METTDFLVVGAGLAGLAFAKTATKAGASVRLLDKGRGAGGRMATRRVSDVPVDHGAQFFTARGEMLQAMVDAGLADGWLQVWSHGFPVWRDGAIVERPESYPRYAPFAGMNRVAKHLAANLDIITGATVTQIKEANGVYTAATDDGQTFSGHSLILNLPPVQLLTLAQDLLSPEDAASIKTVEYLPAWTLIARLSDDIDGATWSAVELDAHTTLGWLSRDHTKRGDGCAADTGRAWKRRLEPGAFGRQPGRGASGVAIGS